MDISRRVVLVAIGMAASAGLVFPAVVSRSAEPALAPPVQLSRDGGSTGAATGSGPSSLPAPSEPVPVTPRGERRNDDARPAVEDDGDDDRRERGDGRGGGGGGGDDTNDSDGSNDSDDSGDHGGSGDD